MKRGSFTKKFTIGYIQNQYNVTPEEAEEIYSKTYEKIRYNARKEGLVNFHSTRETFFAIFGKESVPQMFSTTINPAMFPVYEIKQNTGENSTLISSVGNRLSSLRNRYGEVESIYQDFLVDNDMGRLNNRIKEFKKTSVEYLTYSSR